jgi:hypothetical protein
MAALSATAAHHRARIGGLSRDRQPNDPELLDARQQLATLKMAEIITGSPPLTTDQIDYIVTLLRGGGRST